MSWPLCVAAEDPKEEELDDAEIAAAEKDDAKALGTEGKGPCCTGTGTEGRV